MCYCINMCGPSAVGQADSPPPQRPSSPMNKDGQLRDSQRQIHMSVGDKWLAWGRDVHFERMQNRPKTAHTPGWMEGLPHRPKSAAALRALK